MFQMNTLEKLIALNYLIQGFINMSIEEYGVTL
uniref:Uncharacterized protein n=1 Tax=Rhizophora mucronata TaxID=61149 RepID=A0A2P2IZI6_RHIMU